MTNITPMRLCTVCGEPDVFDLLYEYPPHGLGHVCDSCYAEVEAELDYEAKTHDPYAYFGVKREDFL